MKQINLTYKDKTYTLEYTRGAVAQMERAGFIVSDIHDKPVTTIPALFAGAFISKQKWIKPDVVEEIYKNIKGKDTLIEKLVEMYQETALSLLNEPEEDNEGNAAWEPNW